jgi:uncharacterized protein
MTDPSPRRHTPHPQGPLSGPRRRWRRFLGLALAAVNSCLLPLPPGRWLRQRLQNSLEITTTDIPVRDDAIDLLHVVFLSDLHAGHFMQASDLRALAERAVALRPDLICLGGDLINTHCQEMRHLDAALEVLRAPLGVYAVPGNHEYYRRGQIDPWTSRLESHGVHVLRNRGVRISTGATTLWLAGIDDLTESRPDFDAALRGRREAETTLVLSHHPDTFLEACDLDVDLQLSGHTHGGQICLFGRAPLSHSRHGFVSGLYRRNGSSLYVGRGAGVTVLPLRIGADPEMSLLRLRGGS